MAQELRQELKLAQKLVLTPQLQQAIKLLQLTRLELREHISQELTENPVLEETLEASDGGSAEESLVEKLIQDDGVYGFPDGYSYRDGFTDSDEKQSFIENSARKSGSLMDHLIWQISMSDLDKYKVQIAVEIAGNLNDDGYLSATLDEIAENNNVPISGVESVLKKVQLMDPVGVAARGLQECLMVQAQYLNMATPLVQGIIDEYLPKLQNRNYSFIAKKMGVDIGEVIEAVEVITGLDPKPGRAFNIEEPQYIIPDVFVYKVDNEYIINLNDNGLPRLRISKLYKDMLNSGTELPDATKDFIMERIRSATWLIKSIHQRQRTIQKVSQSIVEHQKDFLDRGIEYLKPMVLRDIADDVGVHESTVSRVTNGKYMYTPRGVFELKYFFTGKVSSDIGEDKSVETVKNRIKEIINEENSARPISDQLITRMLKEEGINIARRTVAKYREQLGILSSSRRKIYTVKEAN
ncbi:MAG: RNA polymerase factor sigma-54 [Deltaproteobacteria bacterium]|nr:RNA polymerase factor sigma-54 [Candidatus Zymogenaceae bacterium]